MRVFFVGMAFVVYGVAIIVISAITEMRGGGGLVATNPLTPEIESTSDPKPAPWSCCTDVDKAVLYAIPFRNVGADDIVWGRASQTDIDKERQDVTRLREWATTLPDGPVKAAYFGWCAHFDGSLVDAEDELATHRRRIAFDDEQARRVTILATIPKP